ncbi:MAG: hypothetical protein U9Q74_08415, partial [Gemmatimonadota bacterium]|nr:hypothetical protein [Gemmatimonadota bacterium]
TPGKTPATRDSAGMPVPLEAAADALYRAASEAARQHERVVKINEKGAHHSEMQEATELRDVSHKHLKARAELYEASAAGGKGAHDDAYWHAANALWHAARDYGRRHADCDAASAKLGKHDTEKLNSLALEYELAASALLAMRNAMAAYKKLRPEVSLA